jgi:hypothetical protein
LPGLRSSIGTRPPGYSWPPRLYQIKPRIAKEAGRSQLANLRSDL